MIKEQDGTTPVTCEGLDYHGMDADERVEISTFIMKKEGGRRELILWATMADTQQISRRAIHPIPPTDHLPTLIQGWLDLVHESFPGLGWTYSTKPFSG